ncbi:hypothetical protein ABFS82_07G094100 [Erythranthe guttata]
MISNCIKDKDEELSFFRNIQKLEKEQAASLLQPVSEEFEANEWNREEENGRDLIVEKNDYNWKYLNVWPPSVIPNNPAATAPNNIFNNEDLVDGDDEESSNRDDSASPLSPLSLPPKSPSSSPIPTTSSPRNGPIRRIPQAFSVLVDRRSRRDLLTRPPNNLGSTISPNSWGLIHNYKSNLRTTIETNSSIKNLKSRGLSDNTPPNNLRTITNHRPASTTRGRSTNQNYLAVGPQKQNTNLNMRRQSCSPSVTRGRKVVDSDNKSQQQVGNREGGQLLGSRMVDGFMNARINSSGDERQNAKVKVNESSGFGRLMSKTSLDMAITHMIERRDEKGGKKIGWCSPTMEKRRGGG